MGIATGLAFDAERNLFVGDRSGTIFKISPDRQIFVFATLEPSIAAYHLAFSPDGELYVSGPTTSSYDHICRINRQGEISLFYRGLGRPQGLAFDREGNLYVAASKGGRRGIVRIRPNGAEADVVLSGKRPGWPGLAAHAARGSDQLERAVQPRLGRRGPAPAAAALMKAEIIAVGSELLTPDRLDTNSLFITERLNRLGIAVERKTVVADEHKQLRDAFRESLSRADLVIATGGLGPTEDDLTREAISEMLGRKLSLNHDVLRAIEARFRRMGRPMAERNARQAMVPEGASVLENSRGTAPGLWIEIRRAHRNSSAGPAARTERHLRRAGRTAPGAPGRRRAPARARTAHRRRARIGSG